MTRDCDSCAIGEAVERRRFLRDAVLGVAGAIGALTWTRDASAMTVAFAEGTGAREDKAYPVPAADGVVIDKKESVIIARYQGKAYAFSLACPHQNTAIRWDNKAGRFQCPKHKSRYTPEGVFIDGRATRGLDRFAVRRDGEQLMVNLDALYEEDRQGEQWKTAFVQL